MCQFSEGVQVENTGALKGIKVMVIDDSNTIRKSAEIFLRPFGCQVILAKDGFEAMSKIVENQPDIIFLDITMPRLDGYQACKLIKNNPIYQSIPVIMLSSKDGLFDKARGRMAGSNDYLTKPFTAEGLLSIIRSYTLQSN
ncbi:MAG: response regulator [Proteobacteria bacterium]|nr:response regulator [Pseudomonadota bacterium]